MRRFAETPLRKIQGAGFGPRFFIQPEF